MHMGQVKGEWGKGGKVTVYGGGSLKQAVTIAWCRRKPGQTMAAILRVEGGCSIARASGESLPQPDHDKTM